MGYIILFIICVTIIGLVYWYFMSQMGRFSKEKYKNMTITNASLKHSELGLFVSLVAKISSADRKLSSLGNELIELMFDDIASLFLDPKNAKVVLKEIFNEQKTKTNNTKSIATALYRSIKRDEAKQQQFLEFLAQIVYCGKETAYEYAILVTIAEAFQIPSNVYNEIFKQFEKSMSNIKQQANIKDAYQLLGVHEKENINNIQIAYKKMLKKYHLNITENKDKKETYDQAYNEYYIVESFVKIQEIYKAYEMILNSK